MMKHRYLIISIVLLLPLSARAQQTTPAGTWRLNFNETVSLMENSIKQKFDTLDQSVKARIEASMSGRVFSFASNGEVTIHWQAQGSPRTSSGTWQTSGETLSLTVAGDAQQYTYELAANNHLILRSTTPSGLFSNLYLTWHP